MTTGSNFVPFLQLQKDLTLGYNDTKFERRKNIKSEQENKVDKGVLSTYEKILKLA